MFRQVVKQWFWDAYDHLGRLFLWNFLLFIFYSLTLLPLMGFLAVLGQELPPTTLVLVAFAVWTLAGPLLLLPWVAPLAHFGRLISDEKDPPFLQLISGFRTKAARSWKILQLLCGVTGLLVLNIWFYTSSPAFPEEYRLGGFVLAGLCFWIGVFFLAAMLPTLPHYLRKDASLAASLKFGLFAALKYPGTVFGLLIFIVSLWIIAVALRFVGILLFGFVGTYLFMNSLYDVISEREWKAIEKQEEEAEPQRPASWKEIKAEDKKKEKERMDKSRYERTFRDIIRPWES